jgi:hypothetical protein
VGAQSWQLMHCLLLLQTLLLPLPQQLPQLLQLALLVCQLWLGML